MAEKAVLVSIHSRKGGVGKTSIAMSTAIQLAALGNKVAVLDLDTHGAHLSQSLPLKNDLTEENGTLLFNPDKDSTERNYSDKPYLAWRFAHLSPASPKGSKSLPLRDIAQQLAVEQSVLDAASTYGLGDKIARLSENLYLFPMSPYIRDIDRLNNLTLDNDGQKRYRDVLSKLLVELDVEGYHYIIIDNSPGLSLNPGLTLQTALTEGANKSSKDKREVHSWFVGNSPWWEQGLIVYEMNVYRDYLDALYTTLIINRVGQTWLDDKSFHVGKHWLLQKDTEQYQKLVERLFCIPMWIAAGQADRLANRFLLPERFGISILGDDDTIRKAQMTDADWRPAGAAATNGLMSNPTGYCNRDFVILATRYLYFFALPAVEAAQRGFAGEASVQGSSAPNGNLFHENIYSALVRPLREPQSSDLHPDQR